MATRWTAYDVLLARHTRQTAGSTHEGRDNEERNTITGKRQQHMRPDMERFAIDRRRAQEPGLGDYREDDADRSVQVRA